jgi:hypothetical protein
MTMRWSLAVALAAGLALAGCGDDDNGGGAAAPPPQQPQPQTCTPPTTATATFSGAVHPILMNRCTPCHGDTATLPRYGATDRNTAFTAAQAAVNTTNPEQSLLVQKGDGRVAHGGGDRLDPGLATTTEVTTVLTWIRECAQNN